MIDLLVTDSLVQPLFLCQGSYLAQFDRRIAVEVLANFVGGQYMPSQDGRTSEVIDPSTGEAYLEAPVSGPGDVDAALRTAAAAFEV